MTETRENPRLVIEQRILATCLEYTEAPYIARQELAGAWDSAWSEPWQPVADAIQKLLDDGRRPHWDSVRRYIEQNNGAADVLSALIPHVEHPDFLAERSRELRDYIALERIRTVSYLVEHAQGVTPAELLETIQTQVAHARSAGMPLHTLEELTDTTWHAFVERRESPNHVTGIPTGFETLDYATQGWQPSVPYVLGARPSHGKTALMCSFALVAARSGYPVLILSHEMTATSLTKRMAAITAGISYTNIESGSLNSPTTNRLAAALDHLKTLPITICDTAARPQDHWATCHAIKAKYGSGLVLVDYIQLEHISGYRGTRNDELAEISAGWMATAKSTHHSVILLSQLRRDAGGREPKLADLRDSGAIEQDAYGVVLLWRPGMDNTTRPINHGQLALAKNRNGPLTRITLHYTPRCLTFREWRPEDQELTLEEQEQETRAENREETE